MLLSSWRVPKTGLLLMAVIVLLTSVGCTNLPKNVQRTESHAFTTTETTVIGTHIREALKSHPKTETGFYPLSNGLDAMATRLALIDAAQKSVDVQYYLYHNDLVGQLFTKRLLYAADRGVRVRMLLDDLGASDKDRMLSVLNQHPNIEVRLFNPITTRGLLRNLNLVTDFSRINRRMHNKSFIVDNQIAIIGGRNIGDEYFDASVVEFADLDMVQIGAAVPDISVDFDEYWNSNHSFPAETIIKNHNVSDKKRARLMQKLEKAMQTSEGQQYFERLHNAPIIQSLAENDLQWFWGQANVYADAPDKIELVDIDNNIHLTPRLEPYFQKAQKEVIMVSAYFVPGEEGMAFIRSMVERGVRVTIVTNSLASTDVGIVHAGYRQYRPELLDLGVQLIEMKPRTNEKKHLIKGSSSRASLHAKTYIIDGDIMFVGSLNLDPRSIRLNTENGVIYHSPELVTYIKEEMLGADRKLYWVLRKNGNTIEWVNGQGEVDATTDPETSWLLRTGIRLLSIFPIESQL
ncbi:phospholipase D family protein [Endozoicomonas lisbonensis]